MEPKLFAPRAALDRAIEVPLSEDRDTEAQIKAFLNEDPELGWELDEDAGEWILDTDRATVASPGDWIVKTALGTWLVLDPESFEATYLPTANHQR
jgi:hypothetical protein